MVGRIMFVHKSIICTVSKLENIFALFKHSLSGNESNKYLHLVTIKLSLIYIFEKNFCSERKKGLDKGKVQDNK